MYYVLMYYVLMYYVLMAIFPFVKIFDTMQ